MLSRFFQRMPLEQGLARTLAPINAVFGAGTGFMAGATVSLFLVGFGLDDPHASTKTVVAAAGATTFASTLAGGAAGYATAYAGANLTLAAFPFLKQKQMPLLVKGIKPQIGLFAATAVASALILAAPSLTKTNNNKPR